MTGISSFGWGKDIEKVPFAAVDLKLTMDELVFCFFQCSSLSWTMA